MIVAELAEHVGEVTDGCGINYVPALSLLPFWPGCADVTVEGQIVKLESSRRRARRRW